MKHTFIISALTLMAIVSLSSCYKAGRGGKAQLNIHVFNGNEVVPYTTVKVKYNEKEFPGVNGSYNDEQLTDYSGHAVFDKLKKGDYYFYAVRFDTASQTTIEGGAYIAITNRRGEQHVVIDFGEPNPF